jgi:hypothetical protein
MWIKNALQSLTGSRRSKSNVTGNDRTTSGTGTAYELDASAEVATTFRPQEGDHESGQASVRETEAAELEAGDRRSTCNTAQSSERPGGSIHNPEGSRANQGRGEAWRPAPTIERHDQGLGFWPDGTSRLQKAPGSRMPLREPTGRQPPTNYRGEAAK